MKTVRLPKTAAIVLLALAFFLVMIGLKASVTQLYRVAYPLDYRGTVEHYAQENRLPVSLVFAVIRTESRFKPGAVSENEARGLMQITEEAFDWAKSRMGDKTTVYDDLFNPEINIRYGTYILALLSDEFTETDTVLCAYHAGWGSVKKWLADPRYSTDGIRVSSIPFKDTQWYVSEVGKAMKIYQRLYQI